MVGDSPNVRVLHPSVPVKNVKAFIALAKLRPGTLNYGSGGSGTTVHLSGELFNVMAGVKMVHVPYKGAAEALTGLMSGQTDLQFASVSSAIPLIQAGRLNALAVTSLKRSPSLPELPTIAEAALPGFDAVAWYGIVGPANLPANVVSTIHKATLAALAQADVKKRLFNSGVEIRTLGPEEYVKFNVAEMEKWAKVVKASGARVD
jgi:tripartite-type tricarboxylate transporter receptor subunit TctC